MSAARRVGRSLPWLLVGALALARRAELRARPAGVDFHLGPGPESGGAPSGSPRARSERLRRALAELAGDPPASPATARARWMAARAYAAGGSFALARAQLEPLAAGQPGEVASLARAELAHLARRSGDLAQARRRYARALIDPALPQRAREAVLGSWARVERDAGELQRSEELWAALALAARDDVTRARAWCELVDGLRRRGQRARAWWTACAALGACDAPARVESIPPGPRRAALCALARRLR